MNRRGLEVSARLSMNSRLCVALACDLRLARADAVMCFPETSLGIFPGAAGTVNLPRIVGPAVAKDLIFTSRRFDGEEALRLGKHVIFAKFCGS